MMLRQRVLNMWRTGQYIKPADSGFHPRQLFTPGVQGAVYRPRDLSTLFQDSAGTTPVTAMEQPVGRMLDISGNGNHAFQATPGKRPVVSRRVNLLLDSTTLATQSITTSAAAYELVFSGTGSVTLSGAATGVYGAGTNAITCAAGSLTLTVSGSVQDASFHLAIDSHLVYQGVNTATDYDDNAFKFPTYLRCDGAATAMQTNAINFTGTDKMTVVAGVQWNNFGDATGHMVVNHNSTGFNSFLMMAPATTANSIGAGIGGASAAMSRAEAGLSAGAYTAVLTQTASLTPASLELRRNGLAAGTVIGSTGGGSFANAPLFIGSQSGGTLRFFNGRLYGLIVAGAQMTPTQLAASEAWMAAEMMLPS